MTPLQLAKQCKALTWSRSSYYIGIDDLRLNQLDHAFDSFQHALDSRCIYMVLIGVDPFFDSVRHDPHYSALLARMHQ